ncbi:S8 family serine peptidase [Patulibacter brassicae]|uniref:S8 family serine peptidase n=1 Tax=Patulibacter brassicae TaxID=1705717 RepID=A0ABU4VGJ6_9ACTN|nr:S8 family serine peptidase [Patulibacter brassicae]MDX8150940.1 S8 family serine peptidase [Patulibacter brassicae]
MTRRRTALLPLAVVAIAAWPTAAGAATPSALRDPAVSAPTGRLLVTVRGTDGGSARALERRLGDVARRAGSRAGLRLATPRAASSAAPRTAPVTVGADQRGTTATIAIPAPADGRQALTTALRSDPRVVQVVAEHRAGLRALPNDPVLTQQDPGAPAGVTAGWWVQKLNLPAAWDVVNGDGIKIAVIDQGVDTSHPQLQPIVAAQASTGTITGTIGSDEVGHGTHVASLACSAFNDAAGTVGAGGRCRLITVKSDLYDSSVAQAIDRARELGADAIVMSFGVDDEATAPIAIREALQRAAEDGIVAVAAAADRPVVEQGYPANVLQPSGTGADLNAGTGLTVTAAQADGTRAAFAGRGSQISVAAYGTYVADGAPGGLLGAFPATRTAFEQTSVNPDGTVNRACGCRVAFGGDTRYAHLQGTSMATPIVAGVAGLVRAANPDLDAAAVARVVKETATRAGGYSEELGWGIVNAGKAVDTARRIDLRAPRATFRTRSRTTTERRLRLQWTATDKATKPLVASGVDRVEVYRQVGKRFKRIGVAKRGRLTVTVPRGRSRYALRAIDEAGNRAARPTRATLTLRRR